MAQDGGDRDLTPPRGLTLPAVALEERFARLGPGVASIATSRPRRSSWWPTSTPSPAPGPGGPGRCWASCPGAGRRLPVPVAQPHDRPGPSRRPHRRCLDPGHPPPPHPAVPPRPPVPAGRQAPGRRAQAGPVLAPRRRRVTPRLVLRRSALPRPVMLGAVRIVLLGAPGSGKGTLGTGWPGPWASPPVDRRPVAGRGCLRHSARPPGGPLPRARRPRARRPDRHRGRPRAGGGPGRGGYVLDGYPRTVDQAEHLGDDVVVVHLALPDEVACRRLAGRAEGRADDADPAVIDRRLACTTSRPPPPRPLRPAQRPGHRGRGPAAGRGRRRRAGCARPRRG